MLQVRANADAARAQVRLDNDLHSDDGVRVSSEEELDAEFRQRTGPGGHMHNHTCWTVNTHRLRTSYQASTPHTRFRASDAEERQSEATTLRHVMDCHGTFLPVVLQCWQSIEGMPQRRSAGREGGKFVYRVAINRYNIG